MWGLPFMAALAALFFFIYWKAWTGPPSDLNSRLQMAAIAGGTIGALWLNGFFSEVVRPDVFIALALASSVLAGNGRRRGRPVPRGHLSRRKKRRKYLANFLSDGKKSVFFPSETLPSFHFLIVFTYDIVLSVDLG